jgi:hypothetical protein
VILLLLFLAATPEGKYFDKQVAPILMKRCVGCHNEQLKNGGISFLDRDSLLKGGAIVPGRPQQSRLIDTLRHDGDVQMPPGPKLPAKEISILTEWIRRGAAWGTKLKSGPQINADKR